MVSTTGHARAWSLDSLQLPAVVVVIFAVVFSAVSAGDKHKTICNYPSDFCHRRRRRRRRQLFVLVYSRVQARKKWLFLSVDFLSPVSPRSLEQMN